MGMSRKRKSPRRHTVHTKHPRYNIPKYSRGVFAGGEGMGVHTEGGGIGFSYPRTDPSSRLYAWGEKGLSDTPALYTNEYNSIAVGGKDHALLKILSEVEPSDEPNSYKMVGKQYLKDRYFVPHQAHTVAKITPYGIKKIIKPKTYFPEALRNLQNNGAVVVSGNKRNYYARITPKGREILAILEDKYGDTRTGEPVMTLTRWDGKTDSGSPYYALRQKGLSHRQAVDVIEGRV